MPTSAGNRNNFYLAGASPDTGNLGVTALCFSTLRAMYRCNSEAFISVTDEGWGRRDAIFDCDGRQFRHHAVGERLSSRYWRSESLWNIRMSCRLGGLMNPSARAILGASAVLDISGGDSFTDLYGPKRFRAVTLIKQIALENRIPLVLLPQTYGPFNNPRNRETAEAIVRGAAMAWARDQRSFEQLRELAGDEFDADRYLSGVDVAFALEATKPAALPEAVAEWIFDQRDGSPLVGINISGLIYNDPAGAVNRYGLKADYRETVTKFVRYLLTETDARVLLIPHVVTPLGHYESDVDACQQVATICGLDTDAAKRLRTMPALSDPRHVKWVIGQTDWFCGTRMHSTIAGLSSGVPTAAIAYSIKTQGVFETCGQGDHVADPRVLETEEMVEKLKVSWHRRSNARRSLNASLPNVLNRAEEQMERIMRHYDMPQMLSSCAEAR